MLAESKRAFPPRAWLAASLTASAALALSGCAKNVPQDSHSGKDYRNRGAKPIKLEDGAGQSRKDVVTYPGGDRVDWKVFEIGDAPEPGKDPPKEGEPPPAATTGTLKVQLRWRPPRPDLDLAFDVFDQYMQRIARAKPTPGSGKRMKKVTIKDAGPGKYYVQVYAPTRGDAGTYRVKVEFKPDSEAVAAAAAGSSDVPDPPTLPAIPEAVEAPPETPPTTPPTTPVVEAPPAAKPVRARVAKYEVSGGGTLVITIDKGKNAGVEPGWKGQVLGGSGQPVRGGDFTVSKVTGGESQGKVSLSVDQIKTNNKVLLTPP